MQASTKPKPVILIEVLNISLVTKKIDFIDLVETDDDEIVKGTSLLVVLTKPAPVFIELLEK